MSLSGDEDIRYHSSTILWPIKRPPIPTALAEDYMDPEKCIMSIFIQ